MKSKTQTKKQKASPAPAARKGAKRASVVKKAATIKAGGNKKAGANNEYKQVVKMSEGDDGQPTKA